MSRRDDIQKVIDELLAPVLEKDGAGIELAGFEGGVVKVRISGSLLGDPAAGLVKRQVIERAIRHVGGPDVEVVYERPAA